MHACAPMQSIGLMFALKALSKRFNGICHTVCPHVSKK